MGSTNFNSPQEENTRHRNAAGETFDDFWMLFLYKKVELEEEVDEAKTEGVADLADKNSAEQYIERTPGEIEHGIKELLRALDSIVEKELERDPEKERIKSEEQKNQNIIMIEINVI